MYIYTVFEILSLNEEWILLELSKSVKIIYFSLTDGPVPVRRPGIGDPDNSEVSCQKN